MASAVMITGRSRVNPALTAAWTEFFPSRIWAAAKVTSRMLFEVATPMHMMVPISDGTFNVVPVKNSIQAIPLSAPGKAVMMMKGSTQDWKFTTISKYTKITEKINPIAKSRERRLHRVDLPANGHRCAPRKLAFVLPYHLDHVRRYPAQIAVLRGHKRIHHRLMSYCEATASPDSRVMLARFSISCSWVPAPLAVITGNSRRSGKESMRYCGVCVAICR